MRCSQWTAQARRIFRIRPPAFPGPPADQAFERRRLSRAAQRRRQLGEQSDGPQTAPRRRALAVEGLVPWDDEIGPWQSPLQHGVQKPVSTPPRAAVAPRRPCRDVCRLSQRLMGVSATRSRLRRERARHCARSVARQGVVTPSGEAWNTGSSSEDDGEQTTWSPALSSRGQQVIATCRWLCR